MTESPRWIVGFRTSDFVGLTWPLVALAATPDALLFTARFGLGRFIGPWMVRREDVRRICHSPRGSLVPGIEIWQRDGDRWLVMAAPSNLLTMLDAMNYPAKPQN